MKTPSSRIGSVGRGRRVNFSETSGQVKPKRRALVSSLPRRRATTASASGVAHEDETQSPGSADARCRRFPPAGPRLRRRHDRAGNDRRRAQLARCDRDTPLDQSVGNPASRSRQHSCRLARRGRGGYITQRGIGRVWKR